MHKMLVCGRGGSGKSTLTTLLAGLLAKQGRVLVVDADESNLGLGKMLGIAPSARTMMDSLGGKGAVGKKLMAAIKSEGTEKTEIFSEKLGIGELPADSVSWKGPVGLVQIGKIKHAREGCACPMGALARDFLNKLELEKGEWVIVDTEAGLEHFGRGVFEGVDRVLLVVDPSQEAVLLAERIAGLAEKAGKPLAVVLNKVDEQTGSRLGQMLGEKKINIAGTLPYSSLVAGANLEGEPLAEELLQQRLQEILSGTV